MRVFILSPNYAHLKRSLVKHWGGLSLGEGGAALVVTDLYRNILPLRWHSQEVGRILEIIRHRPETGKIGAVLSDLQIVIHLVDVAASVHESKKLAN